MTSFTMCPECLKKYGEQVTLENKSTRPLTKECCGDPNDCADYLSGKCSGDMEKT